MFPSTVRGVHNSSLIIFSARVDSAHLDLHDKLSLLLHVLILFPLKFQHFRIVGTVFRGKCS